jgi:hypothetical protein
MIALEATFWTSEDFDFDSLFPYRGPPPDSSNSAGLWLGKMRRVKALIKNDRIASYLRAKTQWTFSTPSLLDCAILDIPDFLQTVREATLRMYQYDNLDQLSLCSQITKLTIAEVRIESIGLGKIHQSCPFLEELSFQLADHSLSSYSGTINDLSSLRSLIVALQWHTKAFPVDLIPLRSASTLTYLKLHSFVTISPEAKTALSTFPNITCLDFSPLTDDLFDGTMCDVIAELSSKLTIFVCDCCYFEDNPLPKVVRMFSSESLSQLTTLKIYFTSYEGCDDDEAAEIYKHYSYTVLQTITAALPCLEEFDARMYIEEDCCQMFAKWHNLKRLTLKLIWTRAERRDPGALIKRKVSGLTECIKKVFEGLEEKPLITVGLPYWIVILDVIDRHIGCDN